MLKVIHRFLAYNFSGRKDSSSTLAKAEFYFLWCMRNKVQVKFGCWMASQLQSVLHKRHKPLIMGSLITYLPIRLRVLDLDKEHKLTLARELEPLDLHSLERMGVIHKVGDVYQFTSPGEGIPQPRVPSTAPEEAQAGPSSSAAPSSWDTQFRHLQDSVTDLNARVEHLDGRLAALQVFARIQTENQAAFYAHIGFQPPHPPPP